MKEVKDYIHLYLGCEGILTRQKTYGSPKKTTEILQAGILNNLELLPSIYSFKPILRHLIDMKEEEARKFGLGLIVDNRTVKVIDWTPEKFAYALSQQFDLFGLIEAGLAIDKTKYEIYANK